MSEPGRFHVILIFVLMSAIWGAEYLLVAKALDYFPATSLMLIPQLLSLPLLFAISAYKFNSKSSTSRYRKKACVRILGRDAIVQLAIMAFIFHGIGDMGFVAAEKQISSSVVAALYCLEPVSAALFAHFKRLKNGKMGEVEVLGLFLSIVGVLALVFPELTEAKVPVEGKATGAELAVYVIAGIVSVCAYGIGTAISQGILEYHNIKEYDATLYANFFGSIFILIESLILDVLLGNQVGESLFGISNAGWTGWGYLILYTLSSSIICNMMFMWLLKKLGAKTALNTILVRLFALFFGIMFNNEWAGYSWWDAKIQIVGACISLFGLLCMLRKELDYVEESDSSGSSFSERKASFDGVEL